MNLDMLVRLVTGYKDDPPPWSIAETDEEVVFRWGTLEARWTQPAEEDLEAWVMAERIALQSACVAFLEEQWGETVLAAVRQRLKAENVPTEVVNSLAVTFDVEIPLPPHGAMAEQEHRIPEGRPFVELWPPDEVEVEPVSAFWEGAANIETVADVLAALFLDVWRDVEGM